MRKKLHPVDIARFTAFAVAISAGTARVNNFSARLNTLSNASDLAALQIAKLSSSAAQMMASCQRLTTACHCTDSQSTSKSSFSSSWLDRAQQIFVSGTALLASTAVLVEALKWIWTTGLPLFWSVKVALGRVAVSLWQVVAASEALAAISETAVELAAVLATLTASPAVLLTATAALLTAVSYLVWRNWSAIVKVIGRLTAAISREMINVIGKMASVVVGPENGTTAENGTSHERTVRALRAFASGAVASFPAGVFPITLRSLRTTEPLQRWDGILMGGLRTGRAAALAILSSPLLVAPAMATVSPDRTTTQEASVSMVFNSTPTIVINGCQSDGIERRIEEALRQHRESIFAQWSRELQRRQRTEF